MSSNEVLYVRTERPIVEVVDLFFSDLGTRPSIERNEYSGKVIYSAKGIGFSVDAKEFPVHMPQTKYVVEELNFPPSIDLSK